MDTNPTDDSDQPQPQQPNDQQSQQFSPPPPPPMPTAFGESAVSPTTTPTEPLVTPPIAPSFQQTPTDTATPTKPTAESQPAQVASPSSSIVTPVHVQLVKNGNSPGIVVLQWLVYAFWGWTAVSLITLAGSVFAYLIADADVGDFSLYALSSVFVLLPISIVCDLLYAKKEPLRKHGAAVAVMLIHAVIFALLGVASLISLVFACISLVTANGETSGQVVWAITSLFGAVVYAVLFARTALVGRLPIIKKLTIVIMSVIVGVMAISAIVGPVVGQIQTRNDRLIEANIGDVARAVDDYLQNNEQLPESLQDVELSGDAKFVIDKGLVTYEPTANPTRVPKYTQSFTVASNHFFILCATYKDEKKDRYSSSSETQQSARSLYVYGHKAGKVCYELHSVIYK